MIIQINQNIEAGRKAELLSEFQALGLKPNQVRTQFAEYLVCAGKPDLDIRSLGNRSEIKDIHVVSDDYQLVSSKWKVGRTEVDMGDGVKIGGSNAPVMMAGPCSIESEEQIINTVECLKSNNVRIMRGGVFKPRTSPYSFRGMGIDGLKLFYKHCSENGIKVITEVMHTSQIEEMADYVDIFQIGARNSQNFNLLDAAGSIDKPVMIKRGISGTIDELLYSAEYVFSAGNERILLCERGIRTFEKAYRNTLDLNSIPILKEKTHLPVIADPSHGIGIRRHVSTMALASVVAGADGVIVEIHKTPQKAASDADQTIGFDDLKSLCDKIKSLNNILV